MDNLTNFWDNCEPVFSHIEISDYLKDIKSLTDSWEKHFINHYNTIEVLWPAGIHVVVIKRKKTNKKWLLLKMVN